MLAGRLRERIAFDERVTTNDGAGNVRGDWENQFTLWARRHWDGGQEAVQAAKLSGLVSATITVRDSISARMIATDWRCRDTRTGEVFNIRVVLPSEVKDFIILKCEKGAASDS